MNIKGSQITPSHLPPDQILRAIAKQYQLDPSGMHGLSHWGRVLENGLAIASELGGDLKVVSYFAVFHDACRENQALDPGHGSRGADLAAQLLEGKSLLNPEQLNLLIKASRRHTDGLTEAEITIQACWDADRLDLARAGITPHQDYLCTQLAKDPRMIDWASNRSLSDYSPGFVAERWYPHFC